MQGMKGRKMLFVDRSSTSAAKCWHNSYDWKIVLPIFHSW